ncbi:MAG: peptidase S41 [Flexibacter sp. CG_4_10_14_3_um_filter_32_15]|nr:MAG: peptidase S41 [Flexibacter sp. CG_4_10_14_3_um_filter_32_15]
MSFLQISNFIHKTKKIGVALAIASTGFVSAFAQQTSTPFLRYPAISPDGQTVAFSFQGDIWSVPVLGGQATRLTIHEAYEFNPHFSPDGKQIAFQGNRYGNDDVFVMETVGSMPMRLTYRSSGDNLAGWTNDNSLLFTSRRDFAQAEWAHEIHKISATGGTPERYFDALGYTPSMSPDGRFVAYIQGYNKPERKNYRGSANRDMYLYDTKTKKYTQLTTFAGNDMHPDWSDSRNLFFISEADGSYNLYKINLTEEGTINGTTQQLTTFKDDGVRHFDVSKDGKTIVLEQGTGVFKLDVDSKKIEPLNVNVTYDYRFDPIERKTYNNRLQEYSVSPNGKLVTFAVRGEVFLMENDKENKRTVRLTNSAFRDQEVNFLNDSTVLFISDREGQKDIFMVNSADAKKNGLFETLKYKTTRLTETKEHEKNLTVSPDGKKISFTRSNQLIIADINYDGKNLKISNEKTILEGWNSANGLVWSPDSKWLAYSQEDLYFNEEVYIAAADGSKKPVNISYHPRIDNQPFWSKDGSKLGFISQRNNGDADVWFVWLNKTDWQKTKSDWEEKVNYGDEPNKEETNRSSSKKDDDKDKKDEKKKEVKPIQIDFDRIHERLVQVTSMQGNESDLVISDDGETFYFVTNRGGWSASTDDQDLYSVKWNGDERKPITQGNTNPYGVSMTPDGKELFYVARGGSLFKVPVASGKAEGLPFSARMEIDYEKEREGIFTEVWSLINERFYDPKFHGENWQELGKKYRSWTQKASSERDFQAMMNLMLGELNASHMGYYAPNRAETQRERTGLLGTEIIMTKEGAKVMRVIPNSPANKEFSKIMVGDIITSVDGQEVKMTENFYNFFADKSDIRTVLGVKNAKGETREVVIRPVLSLSNELYNEWVMERQKLTEKYSNGKLGYIHIQGMNWESFERFERELAASGEGKEGLVIDVRFNGGGWTTDYLMAILTTKQHAYTVPRGATDDLEKNQKSFSDYYPYGERLPFPVWTKPSIALCNANSYSNAEIFSYAYKTLGLGTLVGQPTFGAVISTGGASLVDGSFVRLPFRGWYVKGSGTNMENNGAQPDVLVENSPNAKANNEDEQLQKSVEILLKQIAEKKTDSGKP